MNKKLAIILLVIVMNITSSFAFAGNEEDVPRLYLVDPVTESDVIIENL